MCISVAALLCSVPAQADDPFQLVGRIENFCLAEQLKSDGTCPRGDEPRTAPGLNKFAAAQLVTNGTTVTLPANLVIQMPAAYKTAQQIFAEAAGVSKENHESGLALNDKQPPLAAFDVTIDGNIVCSGGTCRYIAGLVSITQQILHNGAGYVHAVENNELFVGASPTAVTKQAGDVRLRLNDPKLDALNTGRFGQSNEQQFPAKLPDARYPDPRFQVDQDNPTVHAVTGFPMCVPRGSTDAQCPTANRPNGENAPLTTFVMDSVPVDLPNRIGTGRIAPCPQCDGTKQAPFVPGDYVTYAGTLANKGPVPKPGTMPAADDLFISVHTIVADLGIYTKPRTSPAYVTLEESLIGTMGPVAACATTAECQDRVKVEGFTTDPSRTVRIYAIDIRPPGSQGAGSFLRELHSTEKDQAVFGRFRWITGQNAGVLFDNRGSVKGATRELLARIDDPNGGALPDDTKLEDAVTGSAANGLKPGTYVAPVGEYIFPESTGVAGGPNPQLNFQCLAFLVNGWTLDGTTLIGQLNPWPAKAASPLALSCTN